MSDKKKKEQRVVLVNATANHSDTYSLWKDATHDEAVERMVERFKRNGRYESETEILEVIVVKRTRIRADIVVSSK